MKERKRYRVLLLLTLLAVFAFAITVYASNRVAVEVKENYFQTGEIKINLNDRKPIINPGEFAFEPGVTVTKPFFIRNDGTGDFYYKVYFQDIEGDLAEVLEVEIADANGGRVLFSGLLEDMTRLAVRPADDVLAPGQRRDLTMTFHFPEERGNDAQNKQVSFKVCADAVQTKNNPGKEF